MTFKIGDQVEFIWANNCFNSHIPAYNCEVEGIPRKLLTHGATIIDKEVYYKKYCRVTAIHNQYYIVAYIDEDGKEVKLGFEEKYIKLVKITNWKERIDNDNLI